MKRDDLISEVKKLLENPDDITFIQVATKGGITLISQNVNSKEE